MRLLQDRGKSNVRAGKDQGIRKISSYSLLYISWWGIQFYPKLVNFPDCLSGLPEECVWRL